MSQDKIDIYSLKALAQLEGVHIDSLHHVLVDYKDGKKDEWRGWVFYNVSGKAWIAVKKDSLVEFHP
jgi:hypothetical protein